LLSQAGQGQGDTEEPPCKGRTKPGTPHTKPGTSRNTKKAQQEHNINTTGKDLPEDLAKLVKLWPSLPEKIRVSILALVEASAE